tara:strand:+ start:2929 stop:3177 length:249 start_codon:yes stop_codon:yes gene_type:complete
MKITKRQLKRIIKEEKAKLLKEAMDSKPVDPQLASNMDDAFYDFKRNLEGALGAVDRKWWENPAVLELIKEKMDKLIGEYRF